MTMHVNEIKSLKDLMTMHLNENESLKEVSMGGLLICPSGQVWKYVQQQWKDAIYVCERPVQA